MLSLNFIRDHADAVRRAAADKNVTLDVDRLLALDVAVREAKTRVDELRRRRNEVSGKFKDAAPQDRPGLGAESKAIASEIGQSPRGNPNRQRGPGTDNERRKKKADPHGKPT